jgi:hypothetical protein
MHPPNVSPAARRDATCHTQVLAYAGCPDSQTAKLKAVDWVNAVLADLGGKGGGKPTTAQGQGTNVSAQHAAPRGRELPCTHAGQQLPGGSPVPPRALLARHARAARAAVRPTQSAATCSRRHNRLLLIKLMPRLDPFVCPACLPSQLDKLDAACATAASFAKERL